jgi:hypothetical protein
MRIHSGVILSASPAEYYAASANEPKNDFERNRLPERCLLSGILGVGWIFPFHATESELRLARNRGRRVFAAVFVGNVVVVGILAGPGFRSVGVERMDMGVNSGPWFICGRNIHYFFNPMVSRSIAQPVVPISIFNLTNKWAATLR